MSNELKEKTSLIRESFKGFSNFIELDDFRSFLLFTLTSQVSSNILAQLGIGGPKDEINLPYNPLFKMYYQKINLISAGSLIVYTKGDPISDKFILDKDDQTFKKYLNPNEMSLAFRGKEKFIFPKLTDCTTYDADDESKLSIKIDDLFYSLESFVAVTTPNILFVLDAKSESDPDVIFAFNVMPEMPAKLDQKVLKIDAYLDYDHITKDVTYLKKEEDFKLSYLKEVKEVTHTELYKSAFSLIIHVKSFKRPF